MDIELFDHFTDILLSSVREKESNLNKFLNSQTWEKLSSLGEIGTNPILKKAREERIGYLYNLLNSAFNDTILFVLGEKDVHLAIEKARSDFLNDGKL